MFSPFQGRCAELSVLMCLETQQTAFTEGKCVFLYKEGGQTSISVLKLVCSFYAKPWLFTYFESSNFLASTNLRGCRISKLAPHPGGCSAFESGICFKRVRHVRDRTDISLCLSRSVELWLVCFSVGRVFLVYHFGMTGREGCCAAWPREGFVSVVIGFNLSSLAAWSRSWPWQNVSVGMFCPWLCRCTAVGWSRRPLSLFPQTSR